MLKLEWMFGYFSSYIRLLTGLSYRRSSCMGPIYRSSSCISYQHSVLFCLKSISVWDAWKQIFVHPVYAHTVWCRTTKFGTRPIITHLRVEQGWQPPTCLYLMQLQCLYPHPGTPTMGYCAEFGCSASNSTSRTCTAYSSIKNSGLMRWLQLRFDCSSTARRHSTTYLRARAATLQHK